MTAVEWLYQELTSSNDNKEAWFKLFEQAKEIEKEQIVKAWNLRAVALDGEAYYKHTFGEKS